MFNENLDYELDSMEAYGETEAELIDQQTELEDFESDEDEFMGPDAELSDLTHAYASFMSDSESDFNGWDVDEIQEAFELQGAWDVLRSRPDAFHLVDSHDLEEQSLDMMVEFGAIQDILYGDDGEEIGFSMYDDFGTLQEYYYVMYQDGTHIDAEGTHPAFVVRQSDGAMFNLDMPLYDVTAW